MIGFGVGPLFWAPISEMLGRRWAFNASYPLFAIFNMAGALSTNLPMILIVRFLAGTFGSAPLTNAGGQIGDMFAAYVSD
jgi:MFS family permease